MKHKLPKGLIFTKDKNGRISVETPYSNTLPFKVDTKGFEVGQERKSFLKKMFTNFYN